MNKDRQADTGLDRLPVEPVDRLTKPFAGFLRIEALGGGILLVSTVVALALSNSPWAHPFLSAWELPVGIRVGSFEFARSSREWINDGLMTLFFFVVALELKRELVLGELRSPRMAAFSIAAALGGMLVPAAMYLTLQVGREGAHGWGTVMATDTAFVIGCLALLGRRIPQSLRVFMLSLAIVDDIGAILVVAIGYSSQLVWGALALGALGIASVRGMALLGVRSIALYFLVGAVIWLAVDASGIHATITGVVLGLLTPTGRWVSDDRLQAIRDREVADPSGDRRGDRAEGRRAWRRSQVAIRETLSPVERLGMMLHPWVSFAIMPLFAFANAGMALSSADGGNPVRVACGAFGACESPSRHGLGNARRRGPARRDRLHDGAVHSRPGVRRRADRRGQAGHLGRIRRFRGGRSGGAGVGDEGQAREPRMRTHEALRDRAREPVRRSPAPSSSPQSTESFFSAPFARLRSSLTCRKPTSLSSRSSQSRKRVAPKLEKSVTGLISRKSGWDWWHRHRL
jgi:NhaA family Na+:H+ antiporter